MRRGDPGIIVAGLSLVAALVASVLLLFLPIVAERGASIRHGQGFELKESIRRERTLVEAQGWPVVAVLAIPLAVTTVPLLSSRTRYRRAATATSATLLSVWVLLTGFSIGLFYAPAAILMIVSALLASRRAAPERSP